VPAGHSGRSTASVSSATQAPSRELAVLVDGRAPGGLVKREDGLARGLGQPVAEREANARLGQGAGELVRGPRGVGARQHGAVEVGLGDLREREREDLEVIGRGVGPGAALSQDAGQGLAGAVEVAEQRVEAEAALPGRGGALLLGVGGDEVGVEVKDDLRGCPAERPRALARCRPRLAHPLEPSLFGRGRHRAPGRGRGGHRAEQLGLLAQGAEVGQAVAAVGEAQREIAQDAPAVVAPGALAGAGEGLREGARQPEAIGELGDQRGPRAGHQTVSVRRDFYLLRAVVLCHPQGDPPGQGLRALTPRILPAQEDVSSASASCRSGVLLNDPG